MLTTARTAVMAIVLLIAVLAFIVSRPWIGVIAGLIVLGFLLYLLMEAVGLD